MNRRAFLTALLGTAAATALLPLDALRTAATPRWLEQAAASHLTAGDVFSIEGVYSLNPFTKLPTGFLQQFVITADETDEAGPVSIAPMIITSGEWANCDSMPRADSALLPFAVGRTIPTTITWTEADHD